MFVLNEILRDLVKIKLFIAPKHLNLRPSHIT